MPSEWIKEFYFCSKYVKKVFNKLWSLLVIKCNLSGCLSRLMSLKKKQQMNFFAHGVRSR